MGSKPSIVWLTLESVRYDYTSLSETEHNPTPDLKRIANQPDAKSFDRCFSHGIWTRPSSASILTGTYPASHNVLDSPDGIPDELPTFPDLLSDVGYNTVIFGTNGPLDSLCEDIESIDEYIPNCVRLNLHHTAGYYELLKFLLQLRRYSAGYIKSVTDINTYLNPGRLITQGIKKRVDSQDEPLLLYAHYKDTHTPYIPPLPYQREFAAGLDISREEAVDIIIDLRDNVDEYIAQKCPLSETQWEVLYTFYKASIKHVNDQVGEAVDYVQSNLEDAIVIITADHGDLLGERNLLGHTLSTDDGNCHIPLVVTGPTEIRNYDGQIQPIDVVRTLSEEVGAETATLQGYDLRHEAREYSIIQRGAPQGKKRINLIQELNPDYDTSKFHEGFLTAIRTKDFKYERSEEMERLYRLPDESTDVSGEYETAVEEFRERYKSFFESLEEYNSATKELTKKRKQQLRELGYLVE